MLSKLKLKLKCSGGETKSRATPHHSQNPLHIPKMLEHILGFLPVEDLKSCRLVNKFWKDTALKPMRKQCGMIKVGDFTTIRYPYDQDYRRSHDLEDMEMFLQCFRDRGGFCLLSEVMGKFLGCFRANRGSGLFSELRDDIPCTKFEIFTSIIDEGSSDREKLIMANFLKAISPWVTEIILQEGNDFGCLLNGMGIEDLKFPSLKKITFSNYYELVDVKDHHLAFRPWMSIFITNAPQLEKLDLWTWRRRKELGREIRKSYLTLFFETLKHGQYLKIKELRITAPIEDNDLINLSESGLKLKSLALNFCHSPQKSIAYLPQLLWSQSDNLENFTMDLWDSIAVDAPFPIMKRLTSLTIIPRKPS